jgi:hypothetical protein
MAERGVSLVATVHGHSLWSVLNNPELNSALGGVTEVMLGDMEARRSQSTRGAPITKIRRESRRPPAFQHVLVLDSCTSWTILEPLDQRAIQRALQGDAIQATQRRRLPNGDIEQRLVELHAPTDDNSLLN